MFCQSHVQDCIVGFQNVISLLHLQNAGSHLPSLQFPMLPTDRHEKFSLSPVVCNKMNFVCHQWIHRFPNSISHLLVVHLCHYHLAGCIQDKQEMTDRSSSTPVTGNDIECRHHESPMMGRRVLIPR